MFDVHAFLALSPARRKRLRATPKLRRRRRIESDWSEEELVAHLQVNNLKSSRQVERYSRENADAPRLSDYRKHWRLWSEAVKSAFGPPLPSFDPEPTPNYLVSTVLYFDIRSRDEYLQRRRERPDLVHSIHHVREVFGCWSDLRYASDQRHLQKLADEYLRLHRRLGRRPTNEDIRKANFDVETLKQLLGHGKWELDELFSDLMQASGKMKST